MGSLHFQLSNYGSSTQRLDAARRTRLVRGYALQPNVALHADITPSSRALGRLGLARRDTRLVEGSAGLELVLWGFFSCTTGRHRTPKAWECQS